jgi:ABC-type branched-subunit amino acid transport system ATPase component
MPSRKNPRTKPASESDVRLSKITIKNYRSCLRTQFSPHPKLSCLIGYNSSGKTSVLSAIRLLRSIFEVRDYYRGETPTGTTKLEAEFKYGRRIIQLRLEVIYSASGDETDDVLQAQARWNFKGPNRPKEWIRLPMRVFFEGSSYRGEFVPKVDRDLFYLHWEMERGKRLSASELDSFEAVCDFINRITYYGAAQFTDVSKCPPSLEVEETTSLWRPRRRDDHQKFLADLYSAYVHRDQSPDYNHFLHLVGPKGLQLIQRLHFPSYELPQRRLKVAPGGRVTRQTVRRKMVVPTLLFGRTRLSPSQLSEGTFKTLALVFYLISDRSRLLLLEEPEVCIHHGLLNSILELIKTHARSKQIIFSTHSDFVLDAVAPNNVFLVTRDRTRGTSVRSVPASFSKSEFRVLKNYLAEVGGLGEFWRHGGFSTIN